MRLCCFGAALGAAILLASTPAIAGPFGAFATSPNAEFGYSRNNDTVQDAQARALGMCAERANGCTVRTLFQNTCVSIAGGRNGALGWSWDNGRAADDSYAVTTCIQNRGEACRVVQRFCTGTPDRQKYPRRRRG